MELKETKKVFERIANNMIKRIQYSIEKSKKYNTGKLYNSFKWKIDKDGFNILCDVDYYKYVFGSDAEMENFYPMGRRAGKRPPPSSVIEAWLETTHGRLVFNKMRKTNKKLTKKSAAFIIARSIGKKGIPAMKRQDELEETLTNLDTKDFKAMEKSIADDIRNELKKK